MHFVVSWDINNATNDEWGCINDQLEECLGCEDDDWNSPVNNFYVVGISCPKKRNAIKKRLIRVAEEAAEDDRAEICLVISPLIDGDPHDGWYEKAFLQDT